MGEPVAFLVSEIWQVNECFLFSNTSACASHLIPAVQNNGPSCVQPDKSQSLRPLGVTANCFKVTGGGGSISKTWISPIVPELNSELPVAQAPCVLCLWHLESWVHTLVSQEPSCLGLRYLLDSNPEILRITTWASSTVECREMSTKKLIHDENVVSPNSNIPETRYTPGIFTRWCYFLKQSSDGILVFVIARVTTDITGNQPFSLELRPPESILLGLTSIIVSG